MREKTIEMTAKFDDDGNCTDVALKEDTVDDISAKELSNVGQILVNKIQMAAQTLDVSTIIDNSDEVNPRQRGGQR